MNAYVFAIDGTSCPVSPVQGPEFSLKELQGFVGGFVEIKRLPVTGGLMILNEDGLNLGLPDNVQASGLWLENYPLEEYPLGNLGRIVGPVLVCTGPQVGLPDDGRPRRPRYDYRALYLNRRGVIRAGSLYADTIEDARALITAQLAADTVHRQLPGVWASQIFPWLPTGWPASRLGYHLACLLCEEEYTDLVQAQEHGMAAHGITRADLRRAARHGPDIAVTDTGTGWGDLTVLSYRWALPDGREWLAASTTRAIEVARTDLAIRDHLIWLAAMHLRPRHPEETPDAP